MNSASAPASEMTIPPTVTLTKAPRPKSKSLQPCRCPHPTCGKMFSKRSNLKAHSRVHSGVLPYPCDFPGCTKRFRWKSSLKPHIKVHQAAEQSTPSPQVQNVATVSVSSVTGNLLPAPTPVVENNVLNSSPSLLPVTEQCLTPSSPLAQSSPTAINQSADALDPVGWTQHAQEARRYPCSYPACNALFVRFSHLLDHENSQAHHSPSKPNVARTLFANDAEQPFPLDLRPNSVLSESSDETDVLSFTLQSPRVESISSADVPIPDITESLWKNELQLDDPFGDLSLGLPAKDNDLLGIEETNYSGAGLACPSEDIMYNATMEPSIAPSQAGALHPLGIDYAMNLPSFYL